MIHLCIHKVKNQTKEYQEIIWTKFKSDLGRTRLEPISIVILSVIMCSASIQVISESLQTTIDDIKMLRKYPSNSSEYVHPVNMTIVPIVIMCITIGNRISY